MSLLVDGVVGAGLLHTIIRLHRCLGRLIRHHIVLHFRFDARQGVRAAPDKTNTGSSSGRILAGLLAFDRPDAGRARFSRAWGLLALHHGCTEGKGCRG